MDINHHDYSNNNHESFLLLINITDGVSKMLKTVALPIKNTQGKIISELEKRSNWYYVPPIVQIRSLGWIELDTVMQ